MAEQNTMPNPSAMNPCRSRASEAGTDLAPRATRSWPFVKLFAAIGFVAGGLTLFYVGFRAFNPPPPPPGTALCGNSVLARQPVFFGGPVSRLKPGGEVATIWGGGCSYASGSPGQQYVSADGSTTCAMATEKGRDSIRSPKNLRRRSPRLEESV